MLEVADYDLPDIQLLKEEVNRFLIWIPDKSYIVLGASNHPEDSLFVKKAIQDNITVMKRLSGGQTVMLTPNNLMISVVFIENKTMKPKEIFQSINSLLILAMEETGITGLTLTGISDIAISGKKILGSAIYRGKGRLLYHAVLNLSESPSTFENYLKHPLKEPEYRNGRRHIDFVTSLKENGYAGSFNTLIASISDSLSKGLT